VKLYQEPTAPFERPKATSSSITGLSFKGPPSYLPQKFLKTRVVTTSPVHAKASYLIEKMKEYTFPRCRRPFNIFSFEGKKTKTQKFGDTKRRNEKQTRLEKKRQKRASFF